MRILILIIIVVVSLVLVGFLAGQHLQVKDNIKHGVMTQSGEWLPEFKLAVEIKEGE